MAKIEHDSQNVFNISDPVRYRCQIYHYHNRLSRLYLRVYKGQQQTPAFHLLFPDVGFIDAPVNWQSASFDIRPKQECIDLLLEMGLIGPAILQFPDAYASITDHAYLYEVAARQHPVRIIAGRASLLQTLPAGLD